ncbi:MAG: hypothetical protein L0Z62_30745 [Gemmataceae bacterium]|nr:hypothetical protein [Gemmataceae bacterium]
MRCPVCRADVEQGPNCRRCRADLSLLFTLQEQRSRALATAYWYASQAQWPRALAIAEGVQALQWDEEAQRLLAVGYLMQGDFARAWECYTSGV